jgi:hypothetical protein
MNRVSNRIITSVSIFFKDTPKVQLGRWTIEDTRVRQNMKIDSSNEDHCGVCRNGSKSQQPEEDVDEYIKYFF